MSGMPDGQKPGWLEQAWWREGCREVFSMCEVGCEVAGGLQG